MLGKRKCIPAQMFLSGYKTAESPCSSSHSTPWWLQHPKTLGGEKQLLKGPLRITCELFRPVGGKGFPMVLGCGWQA